MAAIGRVALEGTKETSVRGIQPRFPLAGVVRDRLVVLVDGDPELFDQLINRVEAARTEPASAATFAVPHASD